VPRATQEPLEGGLHFYLRGYHPLWPAFPDRSINAPLSPACSLHPLPCGKRRSEHCGPTTPRSPFGSHGLGSSAFARRYLRNHGCFLLLRVLRWFTSPGSPQPPMDSVEGNGCFAPVGFPHSDISGSQPVSGSPKLFAADRVLHRLLAPRHPHTRP
jgi:hypothetical protein